MSSLKSQGLSQQISTRVRQDFSSFILVKNPHQHVHLEAADSAAQACLALRTALPEVSSRNTGRSLRSSVSLETGGQAIRHRQGPRFSIRMVFGICLVSLEYASNWRRRPCPTYAGQDHRRPALRSKRLRSCRVFRLALKGLFGRRSKNERLSCSDKEVLDLTCINRSECLNLDPGSAS